MSIFTDISGLLAQAKLQTRALESIEGLLTEIRNALVPRPAVGGRILVGGKVIKVGFQLQDTQKVTATFQFVDADGFPTAAPAGATPQWTSSDPTKATVAAAPDGMSAVIAGQASLGDVQIAVNDPVTGINASAIVTVVAGPPAGGTITFGTPA